jgi:type I restriction enzyme, S subunit
MIPKGWKRGLLGEVITLISGQHIEAQFYNEDKIGIPYLTGPSDFQDGKINITKYTEQPKVLCESGDILITVKGSGTGRSIIANQKCCIGRQLMAVRAIKIDRTFTFYIIQSREAKYGDTASGLIPGIAREHILETSLLIPPLLEQCRIAEMLGVWDESIDLLERLIGRVRSRKQGLMQQLLTGNKRCKEFEGSEWAENRLGDLADVIDPHPSHRAPKEYLDGIPFIGIGDISENGDIDFSKVRKVHPSIADEHAKAYIVEEGDIAFGRVASIGKVIKLKVTSFKYTISPTMALIKPKSNIVSSFLQYALQSPAVGIQISALTNGSTRQSLGIMNLRELMIVTPQLPEQEKIAAVLSAADEEISTLEKQLAAYKQQKLGLMQQLLTGKIRVGII